MFKSTIHSKTTEQMHYLFDYRFCIDQWLMMFFISQIAALPKGHIIVALPNSHTSSYEGLFTFYLHQHMTFAVK